MQARDIMSRDVECISPDTTIRDAAVKMKSRDVGFLPVCENDRIAGVVTDRDIVLRVVAEDKDLNECKVRDVLTHEAFWCREDQSVEEVAHYMSEKKVRRVLILNDDKRLVGVVSVGDLARAERERAGEAIKEIAEAPPKAA